jgi:multiple sugar transport system permease protein
MLYRVKRERWFFSALILPAALVVGLLILYPVVNGVYLSFTDASPLHQRAPKFVGMGNYQYLLEDDVYYASVFNTSYIVFISSALAVIMGFMIALLLHFGVKRFAPLFRALVFQIWVVPWICITILWGWMFNKEYGLVNYLMTATGITESNMDILFDETGAQWVMIVGFTWRSIPFLMVIALAGLQSISAEIIEASELDGARFLNRVGHIIIPMIRNVLMVALLIDSVRFFQEMTLPLLLTQGGPINATMVLSLFTYQLAFENWDFALASAAGTIWLLLLIIVAWFVLRFGIKKEYAK